MNVNEQTNNKFYHQWWKSIGGSQRIFYCLLATSLCQNEYFIIEKYPVDFWIIYWWLSVFFVLCFWFNTLYQLFIWYTIIRLRKDQWISFHIQICKDYFSLSLAFYSVVDLIKVCSLIREMYLFDLENLYFQQKNHFFKARFYRIKINDWTSYCAYKNWRELLRHNILFWSISNRELCQSRSNYPI